MSVFDERTQSYFPSVGLVKFAREIVDGKMYLVLNGNYFVPVVAKLPSLRPDTETFDFLKTKSKELVEGIGTYAYLRMHSYIPFKFGLKRKLLAQARYVWIPSSLDGDFQPPEKEYKVLVRGVEYVKDPKTFWIDINTMASQAVNVCQAMVDVSEDSSDLISDMFPGTDDVVSEYVTRPTVKVDKSIFEDVPHVMVCSEEDKAGAVQRCAQAMTVVSQIPHDMRKVFVDLADRSVTTPLDYVAAVRKNPKTRKLVTEDDANVGIYTNFQRALSPQAPENRVVVLCQPVLPSPVGYSAVAAYRGRIHTRGFKVKKYHTWTYQESPLPDLYVDYLRPGVVYAVNCPRAFAHIRAVWNMGYGNKACTRLFHCEAGFVPNTSEAVELMGDTLHMGYSQYVDLDTGSLFIPKRVRWKLGVQSPWVVEKGSYLVFDGDISGRAKKIMVVRENGKMDRAWLFMHSQMIKVFENKNGVRIMRSVVVQVVS